MFLVVHVQYCITQYKACSSCSYSCKACSIDTANRVTSSLARVCVCVRWNVCGRVRKWNLIHYTHHYAHECDYMCTQLVQSCCGSLFHTQDSTIAGTYTPETLYRYRYSELLSRPNRTLEMAYKWLVSIWWLVEDKEYLTLCNQVLTNHFTSTLLDTSTTLAAEW